jgi:WD40 repeat protein
MASGAETPVLEKPYRPVALSPDGKYLVAAVGDEGPVFLLDDTGKSLAKYNSEQRYSTGPAAFSPDGRRVAVFHMPRITLTDLAEGFPARELTGQPGTSNLYMYRENSLCFSPDGNLLLAGSTGGRALLFDANSGKLLHSFVEERRFRDRYVHQQRFLSSLEGMAKDLLGGVTDRAKRPPVITCAFANQGTLALTIADGQILRAWSVRDGRLVRVVDPKLPEERDKHGNINNQIVLSPNGDYCLAYNGNGFGIASLWNTVGGQRLEEYRFPENARLGAVAVADDGKTVYAMIDGDLHFLPGRK